MFIAHNTEHRDLVLQATVLAIEDSLSMNSDWYLAMQDIRFIN